MVKRLKTLGLWVATLLVMVIICLPGVWVILSSFRPNREILAKPPIWWPETLTLDNYYAMFGPVGQSVPVAAYLQNSLVISLTSTVIAVAFGMMGGYAFARFRFPFKNSVFLGIMLTRAVPGIALSLPLFMVFSRIGLIDTPMGLIIIYVAWNVPFTIWLTDGFFRQIPMEMSEAAQVDGCTRWQAFWRVEFPLARPGIAAAGIFAFLISWNEYAIASQLTRSTDSKTMPVGLMDFTAQFTINWSGMTALAVIIVIPALIFTYIVQKHLVAGFAAGGVKG